jgi:hypothetical protein
MSIAAVNGSYVNQGPVASNQVLAPNELSALESAYLGTATFTLDGSASSATLNFIDGTKTLSFTPTAVTAQVIGGTQNAASPIGVVSVLVTDNTKAVVYFSGAGTVSNTVKILFSIVK